MQSVTGINNAARFCLLMNEGKVNRTRYGSGTDFLEKMRYDLNQKAVNLQIAQNNLSQTQYDFSSSNSQVINPKNITLYQRTLDEVGNTQRVNVWAAIMQQAVAAFKIKDLSLSQFVDSHMSMWFILKNSMNNILIAVSNSTTGILDDTQILSQDNKRILLILLLVASGCLLASMFIIMPVVTKVHQDKDKLLSLFLLIDQEDVKEQLKKCREFFTNFHSEDNRPGMPGATGGGGQMGDEGAPPDSDEEDDRKDKKSVKSGSAAGGGEGGKQTTPGKSGSQSARDEHREQKEQQYKNKFQRKNKKLKKYSTNYFMLLIKFSLVIAFLESYFLYQYFQSDNFLIRSLSMIKEAATITNRSFANFLLYQIMIEIIATNGTATVFNQKSQEYIVSYLDTFNQDLETFLKVHSDNVEKHDDAYNNFFDNLIYKSVCNSIDTFTNDEEKLQCSSYLGGVLEKGLYSANLAYWDDMREIRDGFFKSDRSSGYLRELINSPRLIAVERLNEIYFSKAYQVLVDKQNDSINVQFNNRNKEIIALFSVYLALLVLMYIFVWSRFVESMRHSLWVTKSMLAILPMEVIEKVKVIKDFLFATSQASIRAMNN